MSYLDIHELASSHQRDLGDDASEDAYARSCNLREHGDDHGAAVWHDVAEELYRLKTAAE